MPLFKKDRYYVNCETCQGNKIDPFTGRECEPCRGTGELLTENGRELVDFIKEIYGLSPER